MVSFLTQRLHLHVELLNADFIPHVDPLLDGLPLVAEDLELTFLALEFFNNM